MGDQDRIRAAAAIDAALTYGLGKAHALDLVDKVLLIGLGTGETRLPATDLEWGPRIGHTRKQWGRHMNLGHSKDALRWAPRDDSIEADRMMIAPSAALSSPRHAAPKTLRASERAS